MSAKDNEALIAQELEAFNQRDYGATRMLTGQLTDMPSGQTMSGPEGLEQYWKSWTGAFPDGKIELVKNAASEDGTVVTEFRARGTNTGPMMLGGQQVPSTGRPVDVMFCQVATVRDGSITEARLYYDAMTFAAQLGLMPQPAASAAG
jgi:ketosteroid isomerase-like protein